MSPVGWASTIVWPVVGLIAYWAMGLKPRQWRWVAVYLVLGPLMLVYVAWTWIARTNRRPPASKPAKSKSSSAGHAHDPADPDADPDPAADPAAPAAPRSARAARKAAARAGGARTASQGSPKKPARR